MASIFAHGSGIVQHPVEGSYTYITFKSGHNVFFNKAPILNIDIMESVDFSLSKFMSGNFGLVTFQDRPVGIRIQGLTQMRGMSCVSLPEVDEKSIFELYEKHKASNASCEPLEFSIGKTSYKGFIVALKQSSFDKNFPGILSYDITLLAVRVTGESVS